MKDFITARRCTYCQKVKSLTEFYPHYDKYMGHCKACERSRLRNKYAKNIEAERERGRSKYKRLIGYFRERDSKVVGTPKYKARYLLRSAVESGKVKKLNCEVCDNPKTQGHHTDYSKPLVVKWLCRQHHSEVHRIL